MDNFNNRIDKMVSKILNEEIEKKVEKFTRELNEGEWKEIEVKEKLHGKQKNLDVAEPKGKLTSADFKKLRAKKETKEQTYFEDEFIDDEDFGDESQEHEAEELSQNEPTYVGMGLKDNKMMADIKNKIFGSFKDAEEWYDEKDSSYDAKFDFDFDEEEFDEFEPMYKKFGEKTRWFAPGQEGKKFFNMYRDKFGPMVIRTPKGLEEEAETEEGNAFTGALAKAKEDGKDSFEVDGKKFNVKEAEEKWIQKTKIHKGALHKRLGIPEGEKIPPSKLKSLKAELSKKAKGDKKLSAADSKLLKQVNLALTLKNIKESKEEMEEGALTNLKNKISAWAYDTDLETIKKCKEATKGKGLEKFQNCLEDHGVKLAVIGTRQGDAAMGGNWNDWQGSVKSKKSKDVKESVNKLSLTEDELIEVIERLVQEQIVKDKAEKENISKKSPEGLKKTVKAQEESKKENDDYAKSVIKKMKEYVKAGSSGEFTESPESFPQSNYQIGKMKEKTEKYHPSKAVEEYIENFAYPGLENTKYGEIKPNEEWLENNIVGSSKTGNNPEWANAVKTDVGEKMNNKRKKNAYQKEKDRSYNRVTQPVDETGKGEGESSIDKMFGQLESTNKKGTHINEDIEKMKNLITYNRKTQ